jgi:hypothetical protein
MSNVCVYVIDARPHRWSHRPQTWHGGTSLSWEGLRRVKVGIRGRSRSCERFSAWRKAPARQFGRKMSRRASLKIKQSKKLAPSVGESEQITRTLMSDREIKLELASEAIGRGCPAKLEFWLVTTKIPGHQYDSVQIRKESW